MEKALVDTNVLIGFLGGAAAAGKALARYDNAAISVVNWMDVMVGAPKGAEDETGKFLSRFSLVALGQPVAERAVGLRQAHRIKLPDAIIGASAQIEGRLRVTRNSKDLSLSDPGVRMPCQV
jgi:predicted nucleic acid-binding protein